MEKKIVSSQAAPAPIGPYNQAVLFGNLLFISGQIPLDAASGAMINGDFQAETKKVMENLQAILYEAGMTFENVIKSTIFLTDMSKFSFVNEIYGSYFNDATAPARETVQVSALPKGANVEISMIAGMMD